jgi:hypothetical protein
MGKRLSFALQKKGGRKGKVIRTWLVVEKRSVTMDLLAVIICLRVGVVVTSSDLGERMNHGLTDSVTSYFLFLFLH